MLQILHGLNMMPFSFNLEHAFCLSVSFCVVYSLLWEFVAFSRSFSFHFDEVRGWFCIVHFRF